MSGLSLPFSPLAAVAATVELRRPDAPRGAELVRLRLPDRPGSLAAVLGHLASHGVDVLRVEVVDQDSGTAIDDLLLSGPALDKALGDLAPRAMVLARRRGVDLRDPGLAMATACEAVTSARSEHEAHIQVVQAALGLTFAEAGLLCVRREGGILAVLASTVPDVPVAVDGSVASLISSALWSGECLTADGRIPWAPTVLRERLPSGSVAIVPGGPSSDLALVLVREDHAPFVPAELDRLAALLRVATGALRLHGPSSPGSRPVRLLPEPPR